MIKINYEIKQSIHLLFAAKGPSVEVKPIEPPKPPPPPPCPPMNIPPPPPCPPMNRATPIIPGPPPMFGFAPAPDGAMTIKRKHVTRYKLPTLNWMPLKPNQVCDPFGLQIDQNS